MKNKKIVLSCIAAEPKILERIIPFAIWIIPLFFLFFSVFYFFKAFKTETAAKKRTIRKAIILLVIGLISFVILVGFYLLAFQTLKTTQFATDCI